MLKFVGGLQKHNKIAYEYLRQQMQDEIPSFLPSEVRRKLCGLVGGTCLLENKPFHVHLHTPDLQQHYKSSAAAAACNHNTQITSTAENEQ